VRWGKGNTPATTEPHLQHTRKDGSIAKKGTANLILQTSGKHGRRRYGSGRGKEGRISKGGRVLGRPPHQENR